MSSYSLTEALKHSRYRTQQLHLQQASPPVALHKSRSETAKKFAGFTAAAASGSTSHRHRKDEVVSVPIRPWHLPQGRVNYQPAASPPVFSVEARRQRPHECHQNHSNNMELHLAETPCSAEDRRSVGTEICVSDTISQDPSVSDHFLCERSARISHTNNCSNSTHQLGRRRQRSSRRHQQGKGRNVCKLLGAECGPLQEYPTIKQGTAGRSPGCHLGFNSCGYQYLMNNHLSGLFDNANCMTDQMSPSQQSDLTEPEFGCEDLKVRSQWHDSLSNEESGTPVTLTDDHTRSAELGTDLSALTLSRAELSSSQADTRRQQSGVNKKIDLRHDDQIEAEEAHQAMTQSSCYQQQVGHSPISHTLSNLQMTAQSRQFNDQDNQFNDQSHQFSDQDQQFNDQGRQFNDEDHQFDDKSHQFNEQSHQFSDKGHQFNEQSPQFNDKGHQFNEKSPQFNDKGHQFNEQSPQFNDKGHQFNEQSHQFSDQARQFNDKSHQFNDKSRQFSDQRHSDKPASYAPVNVCKSPKPVITQQQQQQQQAISRQTASHTPSNHQSSSARTSRQPIGQNSSNSSFSLNQSERSTRESGSAREEIIPTSDDLVHLSVISCSEAATGSEEEATTAPAAETEADCEGEAESTLRADSDQLAGSVLAENPQLRIGSLGQQPVTEKVAAATTAALATDIAAATAAAPMHQTAATDANSAASYSRRQSRFGRLKTPEICKRSFLSVLRHSISQNHISHRAKVKPVNRSLID